MPIQPKSLEEIMHEWKNEVPPMFVGERDRWLRSALASHLLWAAQELRKDMPILADKDHWALNMESLAQKLIE